MKVNDFYYLLLLLVLYSIIIVGLFLATILLVIRKIKNKPTKKLITAIRIQAIFLLVGVMYSMSHATYYAYNDWLILNNNVRNVKKIYGEFDIGEIWDGKKGEVGYYIYTDNGPIMPDRLEHYYYMEYDEHGIVYNVYSAGPKGG